MTDDSMLARVAPLIAPTAVRDYAKARGWQPGPTSRRRLWILAHPQHPHRQLAIPMDRDDAWQDALQEIAARLAEFDQSTLEAVTRQLLTIDADVVRFRVDGTDTAGGTLPMTDAAALIDGARRALMASACSVTTRVTHHQRMSGTDVDDFISTCRMGQTELGSYVVNVICPLHDARLDRQQPGTLPFARAVTNQLQRSCRTLVDAIEGDRIDDMLRENERDPDLTSNLCDALLRMHAAREHADLAIDVTCTPIVPQAHPGAPTPIRFKPEYFAMIEDVHIRLRPAETRAHEEFLLGTVETLNGTVGEDDRRSGEVVFALLLPDEEIVRARGRLAADDYARALAAHERGRGYVSFRAILTRGMRMSTVTDIQNFHLIESPR